MFANFFISVTLTGTIFEPFYNYDGSYICSSSCKQPPTLKTWIIDTGVSDHMCNGAKSFENLNLLPKPYQITLPTGFETTITHYWKC